MDTQQLTQRAVEIALEKKAEKLRVLDVSSNLAITDYFVLCTAQNRRQAQAICAGIDIEMKHRKVPKARIEGYSTGWWILLDFDVVVVHVFLEEARDFYDLDQLWADSKDATEEFLSLASDGRDPES